MKDRFSLVFFTALSLTLTCAFGAGVIALISPPSPPPLLSQLFGAFVELFTFGAGAIFGLLGTKSEGNRE